MSNSHSVFKKIAGLGSVGMLLGLDSATAIKVSQKASVSAGLSSQIQSLSQSVEQALLESSELASLMTDSEMRQLMSEEVHQAVTEELTALPDQKTNLEEAKPATTKHAKKHHKHKHHKDSHSEAPKQTSNLASSTMAQNIMVEQNSQPVTVPIDEVKAITLKVSPTFERDVVESVTLKAFRKVIGYDTFNSILKMDRDEVKDSADHYNITVSLMVRREPELATNLTDPFAVGAESLVSQLDKGFPYDDGDNTISDAVPAYVKTAMPDMGMLLGKLNGENITSGALKNLVSDTTVPITQELIQLESDIQGDGDNVFKLMDSNVTKGQMKNLITDKPAPITVKLAQTEGDGDNVFKLMDSNVTKGQMKNLITDKPAPITVKLAQKGSEDSGVPVLVDPVVAEPTGAETESLPVNMTVGGSNLNAAQKKGEPVFVDPNLTPPTGAESEALPVNMTVGGSNVNAAQTSSVKAQAQQMMSKVKTFCDCKNQHLAQKKQDGEGEGETYEVGDEVCTPIPEINSIDCTMDGFNVTTEDLEGIVTDRPAPITLPLDAELAKKTKDTAALAQTKSDEGDFPSEEAEEKAEEEANSAKNVASAAMAGLASTELAAQGIKEPAADTKLQDPMNGKVVDIMMNVGGSKVDLTQATLDAQKAAKEKAQDDAVEALAKEQDK